MAELLGVISGVAGILSLTMEVCNISTRYIKTVRHASKSTRSFLQELDLFSNVLCALVELAKSSGRESELGTQANKLSLLLNSEEMNECKNTLVALKQDLLERIGSKVKSLTWPFTEAKTRETVELLHRCLSLLRSTLSVDT